MKIHRRFKFFGAVLALFVALACGGKTKSPAGPRARAVREVDEADALWNGRRREKDVFVTARLHHPSDFLDSLVSAADLPLGWRSFLKVQAPQLVDAID